MIFKNDDLIIKEEPREVIKPTIFNMINNRSFYVYVNNKPWSGFDSVSIWNDSLNFYREDTVKHPLTDGDITRQTSIQVPFDQCMEMVLACGDDNIKLSDFRGIEEQCKINQTIINAGDFVRLTCKNNETSAEYTCTAVVFEVDERRIILSIPCGDHLRHVHLTTYDLSNKVISVEIEILFKAERPTPCPETPSNDVNDDDDSPKYDVITEEADEDDSSED